MIKKINLDILKYANPTTRFKEVEIKHISDQIIDSDSNTILFCKINEKTEKYLKDAHWGYLIVDKMAASLKNKDNVFVSTNINELKIEITHKFYPINKIKLIGITGTNGKTTISHFAMQLASTNNYRSIAIGTNGVFNSEGFLEKTINTTPGYIELSRILNKYQDYEYAFLEISSHGLIQNRLGDLRLEHAAWSNFTQDHLDFHQTMDEYFRAKLLIFNYLNGKLVVPLEESFLIEKLKEYPIILTEKLEDFNSLISFNRINLEVAIMLNRLLGIQSFDYSSLKLPEGRFQEIDYKKGKVIIDYAHTPIAMERLILGVKEMTKKKVKILFGAGGNRDKTKRIPMGKAASLSDYIYLTSDNPRDEDPLTIIQEISKGITIPYEINEDRKASIINALDNLGEDILIISGKGHENYQEINGKKYFFSDLEVVNDKFNS